MDQEVDESQVFRLSQMNEKEEKRRSSVMSLQRSNFDHERDVSLSNKRSFIQVMNLEGSEKNEDINELIHFQERRRSLIRNSNNAQYEMEDQIEEVNRRSLNQKRNYHQCYCQGCCNEFHCPCFNEPLQMCLIGQCCQNCIIEKNKKMKEDLNKINLECSCQKDKGLQYDSRCGQSLSKLQPRTCSCQKKKEKAGEKQKRKRKEKQRVVTNEITCSCKKSNCLKKYCKCFNEGKQCGKLCRCEDCGNKFDEGDDVEELKLLRQRYGRVDSQNEDIDCYFAGQDYQNHDLPRSMEFQHPNFKEAYDRN